MTEKKQKKGPADRTRWSESPWLVLKGFLMGAADIIPGVSGGTMALITGIYDRLIHAVRSVDTGALRSLFTLDLRGFLNAFHWKFLLILLTGILSAIFFFTRVVPLQVYMYTHPEVVYGLFFGLILGSILVLLKDVESSERNLKTLTPLFLGALFGFWVVTLVPADTPVHFAFLFLSGMIAFCAMILPGISGSYLLLILGKYDYVLTQIGSIGGEHTAGALWTLFPLVVGGITGLALFSRLLSWLLDRYHTLTLMALIGFLIGSLYVIWPWQEREYREEVTETEVHLVTDERVRLLQEHPPDTRAPSYARLGEVLNPEAPPQEQRVRIEQVERDLVASRPFIPGLAEDPPDDYTLGGGVIGLLTGLILVSGLDYLRRKE